MATAMAVARNFFMGSTSLWGSYRKGAVRPRDGLEQAPVGGFAIHEVLIFTVQHFKRHADDFQGQLVQDFQFTL